MTYLPLKMQPAYKEYLWGGNRLKTKFNKKDAPSVTAESWELSCYADGLSIVADGPLAGTPVAEFDPSCWGKNCTKDAFPIIVKLIDAKKNLSIQVHPSDSTALSKLGEHGKAEMWYVVECEPQASIYLGFSKEVTREEVLERAENGTICDVLNKIQVEKGDVFYILPGTIHAIGAGIVIAEIQQNSNTTFRVYDYKRVGSDGKERPLHLERATAVLDYHPIVPSECKGTSTVQCPEFSLTEMFSCKYFQAYRLDVRSNAVLNCDERSFQHILCVEGGCKINYRNQLFEMHTGDSYFLPASLGEYQIDGQCCILLSRV